MQNLRSYSTKWARKAIQVTILGADTPAGQMTAFLLKQNPLISTLHLQGTTKVEALGVDLSHFDTRCQIKTHFDSDSEAKSVKSSDVIVMLGINTLSSKMSLARLVMAEGKRAVKLAQCCAKYAPKSLLLVNITPISVLLPAVVAVYKQTDWYHPGKVLGCAGFAQIKANAIAGHYQNFDPQMVHVPLIGGPDLNCALPLFAHANPEGMRDKDAKCLIERYRREEPQLPAVGQAVGINRTVTALARGLLEIDGAQTSAFVRTNLITTCRYLVATVKIGRNGIYHNFGLPKLSRWELDAFEEIALELNERDEMAIDLVEHHNSCNLPRFMTKEIQEEKIFGEGIIR